MHMDDYSTSSGKQGLGLSHKKDDARGRDYQRRGRDGASSNGTGREPPEHLKLLFPVPHSRCFQSSSLDSQQPLHRR
jgi:hypothetical protein